MSPKPHPVAATILSHPVIHERVGGIRICKKSYRQPRGFSLLELLVVIAIISILSVVAVVAFGGGGRSMAVGQAVDQAEAVVEQARLEAMSLGVGSKLVVDNDPTSGQRLRRIAVFRPFVDVDGGHDGWKLSGKPCVLPEGICLLEDYSAGFTNEKYDFRSGGKQDGSAGDAALVLEFDREGQLLSPSGAARMVFSQSLEAGQAPPPKMLEGRMGFLLRKYGSPVRFETKDQMPPTSSP